MKNIKLFSFLTFLVFALFFPIIANAAPTSPTITIFGDNPVNHLVGTFYMDAGATAYDEEEGDLSAEIDVVSSVNFFLVGQQEVVYEVSNSAGNKTTATRIVNVVSEIDSEPPVITLNGSENITVTVNTLYEDEGAMAFDDVGGDLSDEIEIEDEVDTDQAGVYMVTYNVADFAGNQAVEVTRTVTVVDEVVEEVVTQEGVVTESPNATIIVYSKEVRGYIGDTNRYVSLEGFDNSSSLVEIELPFSNNGTISRQRFIPSKTAKNKIYFTMPAGTYSGQGEVFIDSVSVGVFDYNVRPQITTVNPSIFLQGETVIVAGSGFNPEVGKTKLYLYAVNETGRYTKEAYAVTDYNSDLSSFSFMIPSGVTSGRMYIETEFVGANNNVIKNKSRLLSYSINPTIESVEWSDESDETLGGKITVRGTGIAYRPYVYFVDNEGKVIDRKRAVLLEINEDEEAIEAYSTKRLSSYKVIVKSGRQIVELENAIEFEADPILTYVKGRYRYTDRENNITYYATKVGDTIRLQGEGMKDLSSETNVIFSGNEGEIEVLVASEQINRYGSYINIVVPEGAVGGEIRVEAGGRSSNALNLEILPEIIGLSDVSVVPGQNLSIAVKGVGTDISQALIQFYYNRRYLKAEVQPSSIVVVGDSVNMNIVVPAEASLRDMAVAVKYGNFTSEQSALKIEPHITSAILSEDNQYLSIKGYGFSTRAQDNELIFKTVDGTILEHRNRVTKVITDGAETELLVKMYTLDTSFDYVAVKIDCDTSNDGEL